jgi:hypothetical protein
VVWETVRAGRGWAATANVAAPLHASAPLLSLQAEIDPTGLAIFGDLFAPMLQHDPRAYHGRTWVDVDGEGWRKINRSLPVLLAAHVAAGASGEAIDVGKGRELRALALSAAPGEHVRVLNLDVDGAVYDARAVVAALLDVTDGAAMIVPGSGRPGRCRVLVPLARRLPVEQAHALGVALCTAIKFPPVSGGLEVYPHPTRQTRLPFGLGAAVELDANLQHVRLAHPITLSRALVDRDRRRVDLAALVERIGGRVVEQVLQDVDSPSVASPAKRKAPRRRVLNVVPRKVHDATHQAQLHEWWTNGVAGENERDVALFALLCDCRDRRLSLSQAQKAIGDWIRRGGLSRANREHHNAESEITDALRRARDVYKRPPAGRARPLHLTAREIVDVARIAEQVAPVVERTVAEVGEFLLRVLPRFKAARLAGRHDVRVHRDEWVRAAGRGRTGRRRAGRPAYARMRDAVGLFTMTEGYLSMAKLTRRGCSREAAAGLAHASSWACSFHFDAESPARPIGGSKWAIVLLAAERKLRREARVTPKGSERKGNPAPLHTHLDEEPPPPGCRAVLPGSPLALPGPLPVVGPPLRAPDPPPGSPPLVVPVSFTDSGSRNPTRRTGPAADVPPLPPSVRLPGALTADGRIDGDPPLGYGGSDAPRR